METTMRQSAFVLLMLLFLSWGGYSFAETKKKQRRPVASVTIKKNAKPLARVRPRIAKEYTPSPHASEKMRLTVEAYKRCMYGEGEAIPRALALNLEYRNDDSLKGSPEKLGYEVCLADALGFERYETQAEIDAKKGVDLVEINSPLVSISDQLPDERRYARVWVRDYVNKLALDMKTHFDEEAKKSGAASSFTPLRISSLVRSFGDQRRQRNSPASCRNEICSTHTTGAAVDISNHFIRLGSKEREWLKLRLLEDRSKGRIVMIQEYFAPHFHVLVIPPAFIE